MASSEGADRVGLRAGVSFALQAATDDGHRALPIADLVELAVELLGVDAALIEAVVAEELRPGEEVTSNTVGGQRCVLLKGLHAAERVITDLLNERASDRPPWPGRKPKAS